jgi:FtsP/CotA-like multicopper oxidase with cupredoxin domain
LGIAVASPAARAGAHAVAAPGSATAAPPAPQLTGNAPRSRPSPHEADQGFALSAAAGETVRSGPRCVHDVTVRRYDVVALNVDVTLNRYLDHDPEGRMYALAGDVARVRAEEARNRAARRTDGDPAVSTGLQGDAIQPLTLRVRPGECLRIRLRDDLTHGEPASIHLHGTSLRVVDGGPAVATNEAAVARPGHDVTYEWMVGDDEPEGTHYFHSHGNERFQSAHGLFGAVVVEPAGSQWSNPRTGRVGTTGWDAVVRTPTETFREFALYYHEVGDENYQLLDRHDRLVPQVDPLTHIYRPDARALNYRSEPFMNRLALQPDQAHLDESLEYSSYAYGDPATPIMRSYLGDPVRQRVIGGSEVFHVHHVHGGGIRWRRQPGTGAPPTSGLDKRPPLLPTASDRTDSQALGPSETYDLENECGAGGCQQSAGDFMYHCHVTEHYFAGMWGIWRVYNTRQDAGVATDTLPPLPELPDRAGAVAPGVTSDRLAGRTVQWYGQPHRIGDVGAWVTAQLPPPGLPAPGDASVWDWTLDGATARGEPETTEPWPGYASRSPGVRPPILFDPLTGKPAYPMLRPHLNRRPPFAPNHGPAPFLDPLHTNTDPPPPGANGPGSDCPAGTNPRSLAINAISVPIPLNAKSDLVDPSGELFVLRDQEDAVRDDPSKRFPLAIRANASQDCLDVLLRSELIDNADDPFSKVGAHIHFMQFDVQASDGVDTGFNYEQTIRPYATAGTRLDAPASAGATSVGVADATTFRVGAVVGVGMDQNETFETRRVAGETATSLQFDRPLSHAHAAGETVGTEFVRYRWYPDVQFGTAFFHDHVNVVYSGRHGLYGAVIAEPPGSTYHDPHTGAPIESGPIADIHTSAVLSPDVSGSFRELVMGIQDDNPLTHVGRSTGSAFDERVEPLDARAGTTRDPATLFSSTGTGDPATPTFEAYLGDPLAVRALVGASNDMHSWHLDGHWFRTEPYTTKSPPTNTVNLGISERYDLYVRSAGGPQRMPGDYLYYSGRTFKLREGSWGLLRVFGPNDQTDLHTLPGHEHIPAPRSSVCPAGAPRRAFDVAAIDVAVPMLGASKGKAYVLEADRIAVLNGRRPAEPLVLHVNVGDCVEVHLTNRTATGPVSFHCDLLAADPTQSAGVAAGREPVQAVEPNGTRTYTLYASPEVGPTTSLLRDFGDVLDNPGLGLYGAIVVGPKGSTYTDPATGADVGRTSTWKADVHPPTGKAWRDFTLFFQDDDASIGTHKMPYTVAVSGIVGLNYRAAPLADRLAHDPDTAGVFRPDGAAGAPETPMLEARAGDPVHLHVVSPASEQAQVFTVDGHTWPVTPGLPGTSHVSSTALVGTDALNLVLDHGAGGAGAVPGDYLYGDQRQPYREAGLWGVFRVRACGGDGDPLRNLPGTCGSSVTARALRPAPLALGGLALGALAVAVGRRRRRRRARSAR